MSAVPSMDYNKNRATVVRHHRLAIGVVYALVASGAFVYAIERAQVETLAGPVIEAESEYGCPVEYPNFKFVEPGTFPDANGDGVICAGRSLAAHTFEDTPIVERRFSGAGPRAAVTGSARLKPRPTISIDTVALFTSEMA